MVGVMSVRRASQRLEVSPEWVKARIASGTLESRVVDGRAYVCKQSVDRLVAVLEGSAEHADEDCRAAMAGVNR